MPQLTKNSNFAVKESSTTNLIIGIFFFLLVIISLLANPHTLTFVPNLYFKSVIMVLVPAILFTVRGLLHKTVFNINAKGIYEYNKLVTDWNNFMNAYINQDEITGDIKDNFVLTIEYIKPGDEGYHIRRIPLTYTQTKSEEEIIDTINFFLALHREAQVIN